METAAVQQPPKKEILSSPIEMTDNLVDHSFETQQNNVGDTSYLIEAKDKALVGLGVLATSAIALLSPGLASAHHREPYMSPQTALNKVRNAVFPADKRRNAQPIGAFLNENVGLYTTDCTTKSPFSKLMVETGASYASLCDDASVNTKFPDPKSPGSYKKAINNLGNSIMNSSGLDFEQSTRKFEGNRKGYTVTYKCPAKETDTDPGATINPVGLKDISVTAEGLSHFTKC